MFSTERKVHGLYRHKFDVIVNWSYLMDRKDLNSGEPLMRLHLKYGKSTSWVHVKDISLYRHNSPFCQQEIPIDYFQDTTHKLKVELLNVNSGLRDFIEPREFSIEGIMKDPSNSVSYSYQNSKSKQPEVNIRTRWRARDDFTYNLDIKVTGVKDIEWMSKTDPYVRILRLSPKYSSPPKSIEAIAPEDWYMVAYSEVIQDDLNPDFAPFIMPSGLLCDNNSNWPLRMELWDYEKGNNAAHRYLGRWLFTIDQLETKEKDGGTFLDEGKHSVGKIIIQSFEINKEYDIQDCFREGLEFNTMVCIDYSEKNGKLGTPEYMHNISPDSMNIYQKAILNVLPSFFLYDQDKKVPLYGLAAKFPGLSVDTKDFFKVLGRCSTNRVPDNAEMVNYFYMSSFTYTVGAPNLNLAPCFRHILDWVKEYTKNRPYYYTVVVIFMAGVMSDFAEVLSLLQSVGKLPISFIIVDMSSNTDLTFETLALKAIDNDNLTAKYDGKLLERDIVQYVNFRKYESNPVEAIYEIMSELPRQIVSYFQLNNLFLKK